MRPEPRHGTRLVRTIGGRESVTTAEQSALRPADPVRLRAVVARLIQAQSVVLAVQSSSSQPLEELVCERLVLGHAHRRRINAVVLAPPGAGRHPAILVCPGRNATLQRVTGLQPPDYPDRNMAQWLARAGFVTFTLDYGLDGDDGNDSDDEAVPGISLPDRAASLHQYLTLCGGSLIGALTEDATAALRWLAAHPRVDPARIGLFGHSLGAAVALHTALTLERPMPVCAASHLGTYEVLYGRRRTGPDGGALPGILRHADLPQLYAALAPAPLQVQFGLDDPYLDPSDASAAGTAIEAGYAAIDESAKEHVEVLALPMRHGTAVAEAVRFFTRYLAEPASSRAVGPAGKVTFDVESRIEASRAEPA